MNVLDVFAIPIREGKTEHARRIGRFMGEARLDEPIQNPIERNSINTRESLFT